MVDRGPYGRGKMEWYEYQEYQDTRSITRDPG